MSDRHLFNKDEYQWDGEKYYLDKVSYVIEYKDKNNLIQKKVYETMEIALDSALKLIVDYDIESIKKEVRRNLIYE
jgi:acyl-homoserine lactone acylase PvdQ